MSDPLALWFEILDRVRPPATGPIHGIPSIFHQIFFPGEEQLPPEIVRNIAEMRALNPDWEFCFYDEATAEAFVKDTFGPEILAAYLSINPDYYAARADFLRYMLCYIHGGVYLDIKSAARRPLSEVIRPEDAFLLSQWEALRDVDQTTTTHPAAHDELRSVKGFEYVQWFIASAPGHPYLRRVIAVILAEIDQYSVFKHGIGRRGVFRLTGPIVYTLAINGILESAPHRFVRFEQELGFEFSLYGDHNSHRTVTGSHYSQNVAPIVNNRGLTQVLSRLWFGVIPVIGKRIKRILRWG